MHADQLDVDDHLVRRLVDAQFPQWAGLPLRRFASSGTVNAIYRLGDDLAVRLPLMAAWAGDNDLELRWLPRLAGRLPLAISEPVGRGEPTDDYPLAWSVYRWLEGTPAVFSELADQRQTALDLAEFVVALRGIDLGPDGPPVRRMALKDRDAHVRESIAASEGLIDTAAATAAWELVLQAPEFDGPPVLLHTDLLPGNLLTVDGVLTAVIDFGGLGLGDPAADTIVAWALLAGEARTVFRSALDVDDATWMRGRGLTLSKGLVALPYYIETNPGFAADARYMIEQVLADLEL